MDSSAAQTDVDVVTRVARLLRLVEALGPHATGALQLHGEQANGSILVEQERVCWVAASGLAARLTDLLRAEVQPPLSVAQMEMLYQGCRTKGEPLGQMLLRHGHVTHRGLRGALHRHTLEALTALACADDLAWRWVPHRRQRYDARFSFSAVSLLLCVAASAGAAADRAALQAQVPAGGWGLAFRVAEAGVPRLAFAQGAPSPRLGRLSQLEQVAQWATTRSLPARTRATTVSQHEGLVFVTGAAVPALEEAA
jgi:hypothetical protein